MRDKIKLIQDNINRLFVGKGEVVELVLICMLADGHILLEDVPGVGKTTLAKAFAKSIKLDFGRIQFTPETLPSDIVGLSIYNTKSGEFEFKEGVVMNQILLADEINRTPPKTQSSLLEAMSEKQVTVDGKVMRLPEPFMVIATQNPVEYLGTYPLPEAQMDRFMMRLSIGYPTPEQEIKMAKNELEGISLENTESVCLAEDLIAMKAEVAKVTVSDAVLGYMDEIVNYTRHDEKIMLGVSPRGFLALVRASQARAYMQGRDFVKPDDVKAVAPYLLEHRIVLSSEAKIRQENVKNILKGIIVKAKVPV